MTGSFSLSRPFVRLIGPLSGPLASKLMKKVESYCQESSHILICVADFVYLSPLLLMETQQDW